MADSNEGPFSFFNGSVGRHLLRCHIFGAMNVKLARPSNEEFEECWGAVRAVMNKIKAMNVKQPRPSNEEFEEYWGAVRAVMNKIKKKKRGREEEEEEEEGKRQMIN